MNYRHRKTNQPVKAIQFTDSKSIKQIEQNLGGSVRHSKGSSCAKICGIPFNRGDYAVSSGFVIQNKGYDWVLKNLRPDQEQGGLFNEI